MLSKSISEYHFYNQHVVCMLSCLSLDFLAQLLITVTTEVLNTLNGNALTWVMSMNFLQSSRKQFTERGKIKETVLLCEWGVFKGPPRQMGPTGDQIPVVWLEPNSAPAFLFLYYARIKLLTTVKIFSIASALKKSTIHGVPLPNV